MKGSEREIESERDREGSIEREGYKGKDWEGL